MLDLQTSVQVGAMLLPWVSCSSMWYSLAMICSKLSLFFGMLNSLVPDQFSQSVWSNSTQSDQCNTSFTVYCGGSYRKMQKTLTFLRRSL